MRKHTVVDADSLLYEVCYTHQLTKAHMMHVPTKRTKTFESKTEFNNWLKLNPKWNKEDFIHYPIASLKTTENDALNIAYKTFKNKVDRIVSLTEATSFLLIVEGEGNFRKDVEAKYIQYKAGRSEKPLLFEKLKQRVIEQYTKQRCLMLAEGVETDDLVCMEGWRAHNDPCGHELTIAYKDKDIIANTVGNMFNYGTEEAFYNSPEQQHYNFCIQTLMGDNCDTIDGLKPSAAIIKQHKLKLKEGNQVGKASAIKLLSSVEKEQYASFILSLYQQTYGEQEGKERLDEAAFFLYLLHYPHDKWDIERWLKGEGL